MTGTRAASAAIVGAAESDLGATGKSVLELQVQAITAALADAGLTLGDVDGLATNSIGRFATTALADYLGLRPSWVESSFTGGSAFELYLGRAVQAIATGQASVIVISFASNQRSAR
ncbi:MAG: thiolase, partial [Sciscionella sp.]